jgi:type IV conjugative transfer system protein TraL
MYGTKFPQTLSNPMMVLWWDLDEFTIIVLFVVLWFLCANWWTLAAIFVVPWVYIKSKRRAARGFFKHLLYSLGLAQIKGYPSPFHHTFRE